MTEAKRDGYPRCTCDGDDCEICYPSPASPSQSGESESGLLEAAKEMLTVLDNAKSIDEIALKIDDAIDKLRRAITNAERNGGQQ